MLAGSWGGDQDCAVMCLAGRGQYCDDVAVFSGESGDEECVRQYCPVCRVPGRTAYQLQGVCSNSSIDRFFVLESIMALGRPARPDRLLGFTSVNTYFLFCKKY